MKLSVRETEQNDIELIVDYFINAEDEFLIKMGIEKNKLPGRSDWIKKLKKELEKSNKEKEFYYITWMVDNKPAGHSNINKIKFGRTASMHLHLWKSNVRKKGIGSEFVRLTLPYYFKNYNLKKLICEPRASNFAPNRVLQKTGFEFVKEYETIPGWINFFQSVKQYELTKEKFEKLKKGISSNDKLN